MRKIITHCLPKELWTSLIIIGTAEIFKNNGLTENDISGLPLKYEGMENVNKARVFKDLTLLYILKKHFSNK